MKRQSQKIYQLQLTGKEAAALLALLFKTSLHVGGPLYRIYRRLEKIMMDLISGEET